jgi:PKD repeat protein
MQRIPLPAPGIHLNPSRRAVVNFPTIVNADPPAASHFVIDQAGFPRIDIAATCRWRWNFGDGAVTTTGWPGRPYDGTLPADDPRHYLLHTYRAPGTVAVTVTAVWSATYTVAGQTGAAAMAGTLTRTSNATLPVREYAANLVP